MDNKKVVALNDDALDEVNGGLQIGNTQVRNQDTGEIFDLLVDKWLAFGYVSSLGDVSDGDKIAALRSMGYIA